MIMKAKHLLCALLLLAGASAVAQSALPSSESVLNNAYAQAGKANKKVMLLFHASWCGWCKKMEASINDPSCQKMFEDNYVIAYLDVLENKGKENLENPGSMDILKKYNGQEAGLPFWLILDANGNMLANSLMKPDGAAAAKPADNVGCPTTEKEVVYFTGVLKATSRLTDKDLAVIHKRFLLNRAQPQKQVKPATR
jgi:thiol-disulfide isomerase/thioredoxin